MSTVLVFITDRRLLSQLEHSLKGSSSKNYYIYHIEEAISVSGSTVIDYLVTDTNTLQENAQVLSSILSASNGMNIIALYRQSDKSIADLHNIYHFYRTVSCDEINKELLDEMIEQGNSLSVLQHRNRIAQYERTIQELSSALNIHNSLYSRINRFFSIIEELLLEDHSYRDAIHSILNEYIHLMLLRTPDANSYIHRLSTLYKHELLYNITPNLQIPSDVISRFMFITFCYESYYANVLHSNIRYICINESDSNYYLTLQTSIVSNQIIEEDRYYTLIRNLTEYITDSCEHYVRDEIESYRFLIKDS